VAFERLNLLVLARLNIPKHSGAVETARDEILRVIGPSKVNHVADVTPELPGVTPLDGLFNFAKLDRSHLELPDDDHLVITSARQVLPIWREAHHIHRRCVAALQIILVMWLQVLVRTRLPLLICLSLDRASAKLRIGYLGQFPEADAGVILIDLAARDQVVAIGVKVD